MKLLNIIFTLSTSYLFSQAQYNYERSWGTYFGGVNTEIHSLYENGSTSIVADAVTSYISNQTGSVPPPPATYYNQFVVSGSNFFIPGILTSENNFSGKFSSAGSLQTAGYTTYNNSSAKKVIPVFRDQYENRYDIESNLIQFPIFTSGVWHSTNITTDDSVLSKYDINSNLEWKTYIPENLDSGIFVKTDTSGNIYVAGTTKWQNLGDSGTYQPTFTLVSSPSGPPLSNSYIVKLNPQGQKVWATYIPAKNILDMDVHNNNVFIATNDDISSTSAALSTPGTFQQVKAINSIIKINGNSGQRTWGTYYGSPADLNHGKIHNIKVTSSGVYILGTTASPGSYYAEEGAFKASTTEGFDLFITKFNDDGDRDWSTYLGSNGFEMIFPNTKNLDVKNDKIIVSGHSVGNHNFATPGAFLDIKPSSNTSTPDTFFSMFSTAGSHVFTSYYGGPWESNGDMAIINCSFSPNSDSFYLYGTSSRTTGYTTINGNQTNIIYPASILGISGYIAKFSLNVLSVLESNSTDDLKLFNNPNNGVFTLKGKILAQKEHFVSITDLSGRIIYSKKIGKNSTQYFDLANNLSNGNYILSLETDNKILVKIFKLLIKK